MTPRALVLALLAALVQDSSSSRIENLTKQWVSEDVAARNKATATLLENWKAWTDQDLVRLQTVSRSSDAEVAGRAKDALERIRFRRKLGERLIALPGLEEAILNGDHSKHLGVITTAEESWSAGDLERSEVRALAEVLKERGIHFSAGELIGGMFSCRMIEPYVTLLVPHLKSEQPESRTEAARWVGTFRAREFTPQLLPLLQDGVPEVRSTATYALGELGDRSHAPAIADRLRDAHPDVRSSAAAALGMMGVQEHRAELAPLLKDAAARPRASAAVALGRLEANNQLGPIAALLEDPDRGVRMRAWMSAGTAPGPSTPRTRATLPECLPFRGTLSRAAETIAPRASRAPARAKGLGSFAAPRRAGTAARPIFESARRAKKVVASISKPERIVTSRPMAATSAGIASVDRAPISSRAKAAASITRPSSASSSRALQSAGTASAPMADNASSTPHSTVRSSCLNARHSARADSFPAGPILASALAAALRTARDSSSRALLRLRAGADAGRRDARHQERVKELHAVTRSYPKCKNAEGSFGRRSATQCRKESSCFWTGT